MPPDFMELQCQAQERARLARRSSLEQVFFKYASCRSDDRLLRRTRCPGDIDAGDGFCSALICQQVGGDEAEPVVINHACLFEDGRYGSFFGR